MNNSALALSAHMCHGALEGAALKAQPELVLIARCRIAAGKVSHVTKRRVQRALCATGGAPIPTLHGSAGCKPDQAG